MRALLATTLALGLALAAIVPHVHVAPHAAEECAVCAVRGAGEVARAQTPELTPVDWPLGEAPLAPLPAPATGAPLGAIPGQSPPCA